MQKQGHILSWDPTRAFGSIRSPDTAADVFFHLRDFRHAGSPSEGMAVVYEEIHVGGKGPRAMAVQLVAQTVAHPGAAASSRPAFRRDAPTRASQPPRRPKARDRGGAPSERRAATPRSRRSAGTGLGPVLMLGWVALLGWGLRSGRLAPWVLGAAVAINLVTFLAYAMDKSAARNGQWRTKENHLHLLALAGGWPGAWCAQQWLRHKSSKVAFRAVYWVTVALHCGALLAWVAGWLRLA